MSAAESHASQLKSYFNGVGFERWSAIYGSDPLPSVRRSVREGHSRMLAQAAGWLAERHGIGNSLLDAGCGTGLFAVAMAQQGYRVTALDIAPRMLETARESARRAGVETQIQFVEADTGTIAGQYDAVACFDVLVHYPHDLFINYCTQLAQCANRTLLMTYAPHNNLLAGMHWVGGFFPKAKRRTEIQMMRRDVVVRTLADAGMSVARTVNISKGFYHVTLLEARRM